MTIYGKTLEINENTENTNQAVYDLYEMKRETLAFNEGGNKQGYEDLLDDTDFFTPEDFTDIYNVKGFTDEEMVYKSVINLYNIYNFMQIFYYYIL